MSDLHIIMSSGKTVHFNILDDGWLGAEIGETILHIEDPIPDHTGKKPSHAYQADQELSIPEWIEIDMRLEDYFVNTVGYPNTLFGFGRVDNKTENTVQVYNAKTNKSLSILFEGNIIVDTQVIHRRE